MAKVTISGNKKPILDYQLIREKLQAIDINYERFEIMHRVRSNSDAEEILAAFADEITQLKARSGYKAADVIDVNNSTPGLDEMLERFRREHWHDEDEVRLVIKGRGVFYINKPEGFITEIEVEPGDMISVPRGTRHWFDLCSERHITAIRLFQEPNGWIPHYVSQA
jgi:1,2-dihydroxy-3-keto-5-methylthiopentene dioxygenase